MSYEPPAKILERYANVLINFALGSGQGIKKGEVVQLVCYESAKPLFVHLRRAIWRAGGHVISDYRPENDQRFNVDREFYLYTEEEQLNFFPGKYLKGLIDQIDHVVVIDSQTDKQALAGIDPQKIMKRGLALKPYLDWRNHKENRGKFTWTVGLYGTDQMAAVAGLTPQAYWQQIIKACYLNEADPIAKWRSVYKELERYRQKLNKMAIEKLHVEGPDADLWIKLGEKRAWMGGSGRNIPSFELFTSPDWRGTEGSIKFNQPLYRYGNLITGIELEFKNGLVVKAKAKQNEKVLKQMIATANADKVGEFSLTDKRFSQITKFMGETLFDENVGGPHGNTHIALGSAYHDCYAGDPSKVSKKTWAKLGYNDSSVHTDVVSTAPRTVTAYFKKGPPKIIYQNGQFTF
jgi:aminopeptidase